MKVTLAGEKTADNVIQVQARLSLDDGNGHGINHAQTKIHVVVLAWVSSSSTGVYLAETSNLCGGNQILDIGGNPHFSGSFVNSFSMAFEKGENVLNVSTNVNATEHANGLLVSGTASMSDGSSKIASCKEISAGIIAAMVSDPGFEVIELEVNGGNLSGTVQFKNDVIEAIAIIKSIEIAFQDPTHPKPLGEIQGGLDFSPGDQPPIQIDPNPNIPNQVLIGCNCFMVGDPPGGNTLQATMLVIAKTA